jgi:predicted kinase
MSKLTLIRGIPGSGKSTRAREIVAQTGAKHYEADQYFVGDDGVYRFDPSQLYRAHRECMRRTRDSLEAGLDVVVSNTFTTHREIEPYIELAEELGAEVEVFVAVGNYGSIHNVPEEALERMRARWQPLSIEVEIHGT